MNMSAPSILIVEDEPALARLLDVLLSIDYKCTAAFSVKDVIDRLKAGPFELMLLDDELPDGSGLALLPFVRLVAPDMAVIVLSGKTDEQTVEKAMQNGASDFIGKPFNLAQVHEVVRKVL
ncbi:MAG TPA: response regulator [Blastocatellia bacterium]|nr:response regulator [Blastocatellia bacterium]